jgi:hypothetical protein
VFGVREEAVDLGFLDVAPSLLRLGLVAAEEENIDALPFPLLAGLGVNENASNVRVSLLLPWRRCGEE